MGEGKEVPRADLPSRCGQRDSVACRCAFASLAALDPFSYNRTLVGPADARQSSSVAQWQSIRLLTGGLLVRVQPEEPPPKGSIPVTWVTDYSGDMGNTVGPTGIEVGVTMEIEVSQIGDRLVGTA